MQSRDRLSKDLADILAAKAQVEEILSAGKDAFLGDRRNSLALKYLLIQAVEGMTDICQHLLAKTKGIACSGYVDCILKAGEHGLISTALANKLRKLADLRNNLVHRYWVIDDAELFDLCRDNIGDLSDFTSQVSKG